jgi:hypothetical protein
MPPDQRGEKERKRDMAKSLREHYEARARDLLRTYDSRFETDDLNLAKIIASEMLKVREETMDEAPERLASRG